MCDNRLSSWSFRSCSVVVFIQILESSKGPVCLVGDAAVCSRRASRACWECPEEVNETSTAGDSSSPETNRPGLIPYDCSKTSKNIVYMFSVLSATCFQYFPFFLAPREIELLHSSFLSIGQVDRSCRNRTVRGGHEKEGANDTSLELLFRVFDMHRNTHKQTHTHTHPSILLTRSKERLARAKSIS